MAEYGRGAAWRGQDPRGVWRPAERPVCLAADSAPEPRLTLDLARPVRQASTGRAPKGAGRYVPEPGRANTPPARRAMLSRQRVQARDLAAEATASALTWERRAREVARGRSPDALEARGIASRMARIEHQVARAAARAFEDLKRRR